MGIIPSVKAPVYYPHFRITKDVGEFVNRHDLFCGSHFPGRAISSELQRRSYYRPRTTSSKCSELTTIATIRGRAVGTEHLVAIWKLKQEDFFPPRNRRIYRGGTRESWLACVGLSWTVCGSDAPMNIDRPRPTERHDSNGCSQEVWHFAQSSCQRNCRSEHH